MIRNEANQTEAGHRAFEINVFDLILHFFGIRFEQHCFCFLEPVIWLDELSVGQCLTLADHDGELAIAVVDELHEGVIGSVACRAVVQEHLQEVHCGDLMVDLKRGRTSLFYELRNGVVSGIFLNQTDGTLTVM